MAVRRLRLAPVALLVAVALLAPADAAAADGRALRFGGTGQDRVDRVEIRLDGPSRPVDVGAGAFTIEWWMKARARNNGTGRPTCGAGQYGWITGHTIIDRDRWPGSGDDGRDFGVAVGADGDLAFGVQDGGGARRTICTALAGQGVLDGRWHHVAVQRGAGGGLSIWVDGRRRARGAGPAGDLSYPDGAPDPRPADPFLVIGAEKHDAGAAYPSYAGSFDELRISDTLRYGRSFTPRRRPFVTDARTVGLYHFDAASGTTVRDVSGHPQGPSNGTIRPSPTGFPRRIPTTPF